MTDEYYTAVTNFHLTWDEIVALGRNSLLYSFAEQPLKERMLRDYDAAVNAFETNYDTTDWREALKKIKPLLSGYAKRTWSLQ
jgi:adenosine deaminase CECR1